MTGILVVTPLLVSFTLKQIVSNPSCQQTVSTPVESRYLSTLSTDNIGPE